LRICSRSANHLKEEVNDGLENSMPRLLVDPSGPVGCTVQDRIVEHDENIVGSDMDVWSTRQKRPG